MMRILKDNKKKYFVVGFVSTVFWIQSVFGQTSPTLTGVQLLNGSEGVAVGYSGTVIRSTDAGVTWFTQVSGTTMNLFSVSFSDASTKTAVGGGSFTGNAIIRTGNG